MEKFEVIRDRFEFRSYEVTPTAEGITDAYFSKSDTSPSILGSFDTIEEARECLEENRRFASTSLVEHQPFNLITGELLYIERNEYDEDEFLECCDVWDVIAEPLDDDLTDREREAALKVLDYANYDPSDIYRLLEVGALSITRGADGFNYAWLNDGRENIAACVPTLEIVEDEDEIDELF